MDLSESEMDWKSRFCRGERGYRADFRGGKPPNGPKWRCITHSCTRFICVHERGGNITCTREGCIRPSRLLGHFRSWHGRGGDTNFGAGEGKGGSRPHRCVRERGNTARGENAKVGWGQTRGKRKTSPLGLSSAISSEEEVNIRRVFFCGMEWNASRKRGRQKKGEPRGHKQERGRRSAKKENLSRSCF